MTTCEGFAFGLEAEFLLVDAATYRPLWHSDLTFADLNATLEAIQVDDLPLAGLKVEPPHRKRMPYVVEGYHITDENFRPVGLRPKGIEIRTPRADSMEQCLGWFRQLYARLQQALLARGQQAVALSFHPLEHHFEGPQNKRRHDFWQWAMEAMLTYGPDVNVGLPAALWSKLDHEDLHAKVNHYAPAMTALSLGSPFYRGQPWTVRGQPGKSVRTHTRSLVAPALEIHPDEGGRLEFKPFEMASRFADYHAYFLLWLELLLDDGLSGRAGRETCVYDLGAVARFGLEAEAVRPRLAELLTRAPGVLARWGFDASPLSIFVRRYDTGRLPADDLLDAFRQTGSLPSALRHAVLS